MRRRRILLLLAILLLSLACGPYAPPKNAYRDAGQLLNDFGQQMAKVRSFRITGHVDHFGEEHRIQGRVFLFAKLPDRLRIDLISPFNSPLSVLTVSGDHFALHDLREGRFARGPAKPCNIARLVRIPMPASDVIRVLIGYTPIIGGQAEVSWLDTGHYLVVIRDGKRSQQLKINARDKMLRLELSRLDDELGNTFNIEYSRHVSVGGFVIPREIRVKMPRHKADLLLLYDDGGVEINVDDLPADAWEQSPPAGLKVEEVDCD